MLSMEPVVAELAGLLPATFEELGQGERHQAGLDG
jgi:hypothetical protein